MAAEPCKPRDFVNLIVGLRKIGTAIEADHVTLALDNPRPIRRCNDRTTASFARSHIDRRNQRGCPLRSTLDAETAKLTAARSSCAIRFDDGAPFDRVDEERYRMHRARSAAIDVLAPPE